MDPAEPDTPAPARLPGAPGQVGPNGDGHRPGSNGDGGAADHNADGAAAPDVPPGPPEYTCPGCSVTFAVPAEPADRVLECPACHTQFFAPSADDDWRDDRDDGADDEPEERDPAAELDGNRIKQVTTLRNGLNRTRSYVMVGVFALSSIAFVLVFRAAGHVVFGTLGVKSIGYVCAAAGCVIGAVLLRRRAHDIDRELDETALPEPDDEPDLSSLDDGSQFLDEMHQRLEQMGRRRKPPAGDADEGASHE